MKNPFAKNSRLKKSCKFLKKNVTKNLIWYFTIDTVPNLYTNKPVSFVPKHIQKQKVKAHGNSR